MVLVLACVGSGGAEARWFAGPNRACMSAMHLRQAFRRSRVLVDTSKACFAALGIGRKEDIHMDRPITSGGISPWDATS